MPLCGQRYEKSITVKSFTNRIIQVSLKEYYENYINFDDKNERRAHYFFACTPNLVGTITPNDTVE
jgi:hypothetical protein